MPLKPGRPRKAIPPVEWKVSLPSTLAAQVEILLKDPVRDKVTFGARSQLIEQLLRDWVARQRYYSNPDNQAPPGYDQDGIL